LNINSIQKEFHSLKSGDKVNKGDLLTDGSADVDEIFEYAGREKAMEYIINEVSKPYELQGEALPENTSKLLLNKCSQRKC
jgi:hypothetical protein